MLASEKHRTISYYEGLWGMGRETLRKVFKDEPGVIRVRLGKKQAHTSYFIPESVAQRVHTKLLNPVSKAA